jgi:2-dehydropantoate 2-reductase
VVPGIVSFNVVSRGAGLFHRTMDGPLMLGRAPEPITRALVAAGLEVELRDDLAPDQWTKLIVNLNNAVSALSGAPTRTLLQSPPYRRIIAAIVEEALRVVRASGVRPAKLRGVPIGIMPFVMRLPTPLVRIVTRAQMKVDPEARSSMWEDLTRGRPTEVDYLNGEIVRVAARVGVEAPLNRRIVELVHEAEAAGPGSPNLAADALWTELHMHASTGALQR